MPLINKNRSETKGPAISFSVARKISRQIPSFRQGPATALRSGVPPTTAVPRQTASTANIPTASTSNAVAPSRQPKLTTLSPRPRQQRLQRGASTGSREQRVEGGTSPVHSPTHFRNTDIQRKTHVFSTEVMNIRDFFDTKHLRHPKSF